MFLLNLKLNTITQSLMTSIAGTIELIYDTMAMVSTGMMNVSNTTIFNRTLLETFTNRIYIILGIFMLFKLSFSFIGYITNPDSFTDKEKGIQKVIVRTVISLILLIFTPTIFKEAINAQTKVVAAVPRIILGNSGFTSSQNLNSFGNNIAITTLSAFVLYNPECEETEELVMFDNLSTFPTEVSSACSVTGKSNVFKYDFNWFFALVSGLILTITLFFYTIDVALRSIKLGILQIISPIPIISYIDPKSSKDGAFSAWMKESISTYLDLFMKLAVFYFVIFMVSSITSTSDIIVFPKNLSPGEQGYIIVFFVLAAFLFMRMAVPFIYKVLGIKQPSGSLGINSMLAGAGALLGGAGVAGMLAASSAALDEGTTALAEGKAVKGGLGKGRDLAAQFASGDPKAKAKSGFQKFNDKVMSSRAAGLGFTAKTVDDAKKAKFAAANAASDTTAWRERLQSNSASQADKDRYMTLTGQTFTDAASADFSLVDKEVNDMNTKANKADKYYQDAEKYASVLGVSTSESLAEKFRPNPTFDPVGDKYRAHLDKKADDAQFRNQQKRVQHNDPNYDKYKGFNSNRWNP